MRGKYKLIGKNLFWGLMFFSSFSIYTFVLPSQTQAQGTGLFDEATKECKKYQVNLEACKRGYEYASKKEPPSKCDSPANEQFDCQRGYFIFNGANSTSPVPQIKNYDDIKPLVPIAALNDKYKSNTQDVYDSAVKFCADLYKGDDADNKKRRLACRTDYMSGVVNQCIKGNPSVKEYENCTKEKKPSVEQKLKDEASGDNEDNLDCDATGAVLSWIACPLIDMGTKFSDFAFQQFIKPMLENVPIGTSSSDGSYKAWQSFRIMGNILLVGAMLLIVFAQTRGGGGR